MRFDVLCISCKKSEGTMELSKSTASPMIEDLLASLAQRLKQKSNVIFAVRIRLRCYLWVGNAAYNLATF
jgi:hypothetical protein